MAGLGRSCKACPSRSPARRESVFDLGRTMLALVRFFFRAQALLGPESPKSKCRCWMLEAGEAEIAYHERVARRRVPASERGVDPQLKVPFAAKEEAVPDVWTPEQMATALPAHQG